MALSVTHAFNSVKADGPDTTLVQPSNWNAAHTITMSNGKLLGRSSSGAGAAEELSVGGSLQLAAGALDRAALTGAVTAAAGSNTTTLANNAVGTAHLQDGSVTSAKLDSSVQTVPSGAMMPFVGVEAVCPNGWIVSTGQAIGSASSGAPKAGSEYEPLFTLLWNSFSNAVLPILDSSGSATTRGASAAADFAANKRLPTPDMRGRTIFGVDNMGGSTANRLTADTSISALRHTMGGAGGADAITLAAGQIPDHAHGAGSFAAAAAGGHGHNLLQQPTDGGGSGTRTVKAASVNNEGTGTLSQNGDAISTVANHTHTISGTTGSPTNGSGDAHDNMPPMILMNWIIKL